jgi:hypothetical protein
VKIVKKTITFIFFIAISTSCIGNNSMQKTNPTTALETAMVFVQTSAAETQTAQPVNATAAYTLTPGVDGTHTAIPGPYDVIPPNPDQQVYIDPDGWYSIYFPLDLQATDQKNLFSGKNGSLETGYLPEMGYMSKDTNVCAWLANIELQPEQSSINWMSPCSVSTTRENFYAVNYVIYENPGADFKHRFVYVKTDQYYGSPDKIHFSFSWLHPANNTNLDTSIPPQTQREILFWQAATSMPSNISVTEYSLPPEAQDPKTKDMLFGFIPREAWPVGKTGSPTSSKEPDMNEQLKPLGYKLKVDETSTGWRQQLFRDGRLLFDYVADVSPVYTFSTESGPLTAFIVSVINTQENGKGGHRISYLIQNDAILAWEYNHQDPRHAPVLYKGEILWVKTSSDNKLVEVIKSNRNVVFSFVPYTEPMYALSGFNIWEDHWILEAGDFLIQDGEILNETLGFQEIFSWSLVKDKPTYFFRMDSKVGLSHDGQILPLQYDDVAHGLCCGPAQNNPYLNDDSVHFFGKRNGEWFYVVLKFE